MPNISLKLKILLIKVGIYISLQHTCTCLSILIYLLTHIDVFTKIKQNLFCRHLTMAEIQLLLRAE